MPKPKIVVVGGGIAGCTTALELAKQDKYEVVIVDRDKDILKGTSARTPGRMGLGYHYFDFNTAKLYMEHTIGFMKQYSDCFLGDEETSPYLCNGRYFVTNDSIMPLQKVMASYDKICAHFEKMCKADPSNNIFNTILLHRTMDSEEFEKDVNMEKVHFAIETKERLLDWNKFETRIKNEINSTNIKIIKNCELDNVKTTLDGRFNLSSGNGVVLENIDYVINCTWQNIGYLNEQIGIYDTRFKQNNPNQSVTSRLKLLAEVSLPESLKEKHSMFFCVGPHAMFSNMGNGIGRITYAPITNFATTAESKMPAQFEKWLSNGLSEVESEQYGNQIIRGVAEYIPEMVNAKVLSVIPGIVLTKGSVKLDDPRSPFHKRDYDGVEEQQIGWVDNAAMKLFYSLGNASKVAEIIEQQEKSNLVIKDIANKTSQSLLPNDGQVNNPIDFRSNFFCTFFEGHLRKNFKSSEILENPDQLGDEIKQSATGKALYLKDIPSSVLKNASIGKELSDKSNSASRF